MAYTYKGTKVKGTGSSAKKGHATTKKGESYYNTSEGHVYESTKKGDKGDKIWKYKKTEICKKPDTAVSNLKLKRDSAYTMKGTWGVPKKLTDKENGGRATDLKITWWLGVAGTDPKKAYTDKKETDTEETINLNNVKFGNKTYKRTEFYPLAGKSKLDYVSIQVQPSNKKGAGAPAKVQTSFKIPREPSIGAFSFDTETGLVSVTITTNAGADLYERYDTRYKMTIRNTRTGKYWTQTNSSSISTSITLTYNVSDYQQFSYDQYAEITVETWARGFKGDSKHVTKKYYVGYPAQPTIQGIDVSSKSSSGKCTVGIKTNSTTAHPVDRVRLETLANVSYASAAEIPGDAAWESTDIIDDAACTALAIGVSSLIPDRGKHTWVRVKSWHLSESVLYRYSGYDEVKALFDPAPTAADDEIKILSAVPGDDGKSIVVLLGWNADGQDDSTGTELTWSDDENAWRSTKNPDSYEFTWSDDPVTHEGITYHNSATVHISDLDEGTSYYIRARRYLEDDVTTYSPYSNIATCFTSERPEAIVASCGRYVPTGASLPVYWTFSGNGLQTAWQIVASNGTIIANGEGSIGATQITADRLAQFATNNSITFTVQASTGSGFVVSEEHTVTVVDNPTISLNVTSPLTVQPMSFTATASTLCDLIVIVSSTGANGQFPDGVRRQTAGDTIHSAVYAPIWTETNDVLTATVELPSGLDFWEGCRYEIEVTAIDRSTELRSEPVTVPFEIAWAHQAPSVYPVVTYALSEDTEADIEKNYYEYDSTTQTYNVVMEVEETDDPVSEGWYEMTETPCVTLTPIDTTDDTGAHRQAVQIDLTPPTGSASTDVYDIYRLTGDGAYLIGEGFPLTYTAVDEYAPFGTELTLHYRVAIRTADGDFEFADIEYLAEGNNMRFDWAEGSLELPYNLSIADKYKKDVEVRDHMNGSTDAYWNQNVRRSASLNSDLIYLDQQDEITLARHLARYTGPVFVRTPDGSAYEADVQVSDLSGDGRMSAIELDATEIGLTQEFILPTPFEVTEPEG